MAGHAGRLDRFIYKRQQSLDASRELRMRRTRGLFRLVAAGVALGLAGCDQDVTSPATRPAAAPVRVASASDNVVLQWDNAALQAIRATKPGPPIAARALAIVHTAMYDAWAAYDHQAVATRFGGTLRRPPVERTLVNTERSREFRCIPGFDRPLSHTDARLQRRDGEPRL